MPSAQAIFKRRTVLKAGLSSLALVNLGRPTSSRAVNPSDNIAEAAHQEIWRRFIDSRFDTMLHYAGLNGEVILPTREECLAAKPNGLSWSTPIEDGPFFGGLYLDGLCNRWRAKRDEESANKAHRIATGLMKLASLSPTPGFVPRGIGADGQSCYPASSEDQVFPWFYGLWCYWRSGLMSEADRPKLVALLRDTVIALESHQWRVPCIRPDFGYRGTFTRATAHDAARFLLLLRAMHEMTGEVQWLEQYQSRMIEKIGKQGQTRLQVCASGLEYGGHNGSETYLWTHSMSQASLRALADLETDAETRNAYTTGLRVSAERAAPHLERASKYDPLARSNFDIDWRFLNASWKPQKNSEEAIALGRSQLPLWASHNPRSPYEDDTAREPLFAAWIIALAGEKTHDQPPLESMLKRYDWSSMHTASMFIVINLQFESHRGTSPTQ
ncbi:hypothetical protein FEM03_09590 [Phragmitibacter flavus]|uniref:Uncharacterized protein n=1 Tax=Phragmitibacter flavus TaxID=2576071 RepID=A0A5R8KFR9_9BACT|nr:hypothetical protein [Phragmitibacter flavus]TLD71152.1 hypothetical protein FEM03_09590 [Phragmitibacter flavus]